MCGTRSTHKRSKKYLKTFIVKTPKEPLGRRNQGQKYITVTVCGSFFLRGEFHYDKDQTMTA
jgi:hypothetical protein